MNITLCMIVKNEETSLPRCLDSVKDVVEEMIIVDTGSTDATIDIIKAYGANLYRFEWNNNFSTARNYGLQYVKTDWIISLDADEVLAKEIVPEIKAGIKSPQNLLINFLRQEVGANQSPYSLVSRCFRRHPQVYFNRPYHSMVDDSVIKLLTVEPDWQIIEIDKVGIYHYGYQPGAISSLDKDTRARIIMEGFYRENPEDAYVCSKLAGIYIKSGEVEKGISLLQQALNFSTTPHILFEIHYHLGNAYTRRESIPLALEHYEQAIEQPISDILKLGAYNNLASLMQALGDSETGIKIYREAISIDPGFALGYYNLGMTLKQIGRYLEAIEAYQKAIELDPDYAYTYQNLGVAYLKIGKIKLSLEAFEQAIALHRSQNNHQEAERLLLGLNNLGLSRK